MTVTVPAPPQANAGQFVVQQLNGQQLEVLSQEEADFYAKQVADYQRAFTFTNVSDLNDLDRLLADELQAFRIQRMLASGRDPDGTLLPTGMLESLRTAMRGLAKDIITNKNALGMSVTARNKDQSSVGTYLNELRIRAKEQGVKRERQLDRALVLMNELKSLVSTYDRSNDTEKDRLGLQNEADIVKWVRDYMIPEFDDVDAHFRQHQQRLWVGRL